MKNSNRHEAGLIFAKNNIRYIDDHLGPGIGPERWDRPEAVGRGQRPFKGQSQVRHQK